MKIIILLNRKGFTIPIESSEIHGITNERAHSEGISLIKVLEDFKLLLDDAHTIVAHNISYDEKIIGCEYLRLNLPNPLVGKNKICTMKSSTNYCAITGPYGYEWPKLSELHYKLFKANYEEAHNAMVDIQATSKCFWELAKRGIFKLNNSSSNNIEKITNINTQAEKDIENSEQIDLINKLQLLNKKLESVSYQWNYWNEYGIGSGDDLEGQSESIEKCERLDYEAFNLQSQKDEIEELLKEQGITEESHPEIFEMTKVEVKTVKLRSYKPPQISDEDVVAL